MRRLRQNEICLAGENLKSTLAELAAQLFARGDNPFEVGSVKRQVRQSRQGGNLAKAIDVVAVADFLQRSNEFRVTDEISDPLKA